MKNYKLFIFITVFFICLAAPFNVQAIASNNNTSTKDTEAVENLYNYMTNIKNQYEVLKDLDARTFVKDYIKSGDGKFSLTKISKGLIIYSFRELASSLKLMATLISIAVICALLNNLQKAFSNESLSNIAYFACYGLIIILMSKSFYMGVNIASETINKMVDFMTALIPVLLMLVATVGGLTEAAVMDPIIIGAINISARIFVDFIIPLILMSFVLQFVNNLSDEYKISNLTKLLNQIALWCQGVIMTVFIGIITIRGITSKTLDAVTAKTAKYAVDNFVPVVGKCLSDAISTVAGYSLLLKNALSTVGLIILLFIVVYPIIKIVVLALVYKLTAALIEPISDSRLVKTINSAGDSLILIMSCLISVSVMFFIMISIIATAGKALIG
ncbi:MAG: stage sporulation protein [Clostridiaceae bacterium]|nr:stage sporulation protein [Clostridiaceae bacterium]